MTIAPTPDEINKLEQLKRQLDKEDPSCFVLESEGSTARARRRAAEEYRAVIALNIGIYPAEFNPWMEKYYDPEAVEKWKHHIEVVCEKGNPYCVRPLHLIMVETQKHTRFTLTPLYNTHHLSEEERVVLFKRWIRGLP